MRFLSNTRNPVWPPGMRYQCNPSARSALQNGWPQFSELEAKSPSNEALGFYSGSFEREGMSGVTTGKSTTEYLPSQYLLCFYLMWTHLQRMLCWLLTTGKTYHMERAIALCNKDKQRSLERPDIMLQNHNCYK